MAHSATRIAKEFVDRAGTDRLTPMQVLKLVYIAQGWMLGLYGEPLVLDDVEAWRYGPVYRDIYRQVAGKTSVEDIRSRHRGELDARERRLVDQVWERYGKMSGLQLSALTHAWDTPWDITYRERGQNSVIPQDLIRKHYASKIAA